MKAGPLLLLAGLLVLALLANSALYTVSQTQQALLTQFGRVVRVVKTPGLHIKLPLIQTAIILDKRLLDLALPSEEVILGDQRRLIVDGFARFRIVNPLRFYQAAGATETTIDGRLNSVVTAALRRVLGNEQLLDVLSAQRTRIMAHIRDEVNAQMRPFGVAVEDVRIRRADLPEENTEAVLSRMKSERQRVAAEARAKGAEAAAKIRAQADRERTVLLADAKAEADQLRGQGEAQAISILAKANGEDPHFFAFWRTLQAYRAIADAGKTRLVLTPATPFLQMLTKPPTSAVLAPAGDKQAAAH